MHEPGNRTTGLNTFIFRKVTRSLRLFPTWPARRRAYVMISRISPPLNWSTGMCGGRTSRASTESSLRSALPSSVRFIGKIVLGLALTCCLEAAPPPDDVAIVVRPDVPIDDLSFEEVRKLFLGERQFWPKNLRVTLLIRAPTARE